MSWQQNILNASVSVNRCVWALNVRKFNNPALSTFKNEEERNDYVKSETKTAIKDLQKALKDLGNELNFDYDK